MEDSCPHIRTISGRITVKNYNRAHVYEVALCMHCKQVLEYNSYSGAGNIYGTNKMRYTLYKADLSPGLRRLHTGLTQENIQRIMTPQRGLTGVHPRWEMYS